MAANEPGTSKSAGCHGGDPQHQQQRHHTDHAEQRGLCQVEQISLLQLHPEHAVIFRDGAGAIGDKLHADHLDVIAALFVIADGGSDQAGDAVPLLG
jgi:hypothetical protein